MVKKMPTGKILFYNNTDKNYVGESYYYDFANYASSPITVSIPSDLTSDGRVVLGSVDLTAPITFPTSEHLFHALKFTQPGRVDIPIIQQIANQPAPRAAQRLAGTKNNTGFNTEHWWYNGYGVAGYCYRAMHWVLREKAKQNSTFKQKLIATGNAEIIENAGNEDKNWGNGETGNGEIGIIDKSKGRNWLGELLMNLRTELQNETGWTIPTPPPTPPSTPPPSLVSNVGKLGEPEIRTFETKIEIELRNKGIATSDLSPRYQNWFNYIGTKEWKVGELDKYETDLKDEIKRVVSKKNQSSSSPASNPVPSTKADQDYRDRWVKSLEKEFQELEFGSHYNDISRRFETFKNKITSYELDTEDRVDSLAREFLEILQKLGKKKSGTTVPSQKPENEDSPNKLTPQEEASLLNQLEDLNEKSAEDLDKKEVEPIKLNSIKEYFEENDIYSIALEDNGDLTIKFQNKTTRTTLANSEKLQQIKQFFRQNNKKFLDREELNNSHDTNPKEPSYLPHLLLGGGLVVLFIFSAIIIQRWKRNKKIK